jgi:hypothetical protein
MNPPKDQTGNSSVMRIVNHIRAAAGAGSSGAGDRICAVGGRVDWVQM